MTSNSAYLRLLRRLRQLPQTPPLTPIHLTGVALSDERDYLNFAVAHRDRRGVVSVEHLYTTSGAITAEELRRRIYERQRLTMQPDVNGELYGEPLILSALKELSGCLPKSGSFGGRVWTQTPKSVPKPRPGLLRRIWRYFFGDPFDA